MTGESVTPDMSSDLDIGLHLVDLPKNMFDFYGNLYSELSDVFEPFDIDIVFLNEVDYLMKFEIISGHRIYAQDEDFADEYEEKVMKFAEDINFKQKLFEKDFLEALRDNYFEIKLNKIHNDSNIIREFLIKLERLSKFSREEFLSDERNPAACESFLRRCIEAMFDIGRHILAKSFNFKPF